MAIGQAIPDMRPISDLRTRLADIEAQAMRTHEPIVLTRNGKPKLVVFDCDAYNERVERERHVQKLREAEIEARYRSEAFTLADSKERIAQIARVVESMNA